MIHYEPIPLMEAHFFLAARQSGFSVHEYFSKGNSKELQDSGVTEEYINILEELEARLNNSIAVSDEDLTKLYGEIEGTDSPNGFPSVYFLANIIVGGLEYYQQGEELFSNIMDNSNEITDRVAFRFLEDGAEKNTPKLTAIDIVTSSSLPTENKLLLIDLILHPNKYIDMLKSALLPVAYEFTKCMDLIEPLLKHFRTEYAEVKSFDAESKLLTTALSQDLPNVKEYNIFPLVTSFNIVAFGFMDDEHTQVFMGIGVLDDILRKYTSINRNTNYKLSNTISVLSSKSRFDILAKLSEGPQYGRELAAYLGLTPATVSHHINVLLAEGLVKLDTSGKRVYYSLNYECTEAFVGMLQKLLTRNTDSQQ